MPRPALSLVLLLVICLSLTGFVLHRDPLRGRQPSQSALAVLFGDGRRLFANHFLSKADAYFHRGRYPSIFEVAEGERGNVLVARLADAGELAETVPGAQPEHADPGGVQADEHVHGPDCEHADDEAHEHDATCAHAEPAERPDDWIARLAGRLQPDRHVHLEAGAEKEMLPWIRLAVEMDPHNVDAYAVGGYWLREMGKPEEARVFLREGQRNNPDSFEIYFELGRLCEAEAADEAGLRLAARLYELALAKWDKAHAGTPQSDTLVVARILGRLGHLEERRGNLEAALRCYTLLKEVAINPEGVQRRIDATREQMEHTPPGSEPH